MKKIITITIFLVLLITTGVLLLENNNAQYFSPKERNATENSTGITSSPLVGSTGAGQIIETRLKESFSKARIGESNARFYQPNQNLPPLYDVNVYEVRFTSTDDKNQPLEITSQLFIPNSGANKPFPLYIFGQGTTGIGDQCAPSKENLTVSNWGNYQAHMLSYASQGYIVMFPDYEGFNDSARIHHYFSAEMEARVLLDSARATYAFIKKRPDVRAAQSVFFAGYSQGGHAVMAVKDTARRYAPELPIKGVIGYGATANMIALLKENPTLAPYVVYAYADLYGQNTINARQVFVASIVATFEQDVLNICIGDIYKRYGYDPKAIYNTAFYDALYNDNLEVAFPAFKKALDKNSSGYDASSIPALILQGTTDPIVTVKSQREYLRKVCQAGNVITYIEYPGVHHYQTRQVSFRDTLSWMASIQNGSVPGSDCKKFLQ